MIIIGWGGGWDYFKWVSARRCLADTKDIGGSDCEGRDITLGRYIGKDLSWALCKIFSLPL